MYGKDLLTRQERVEVRRDYTSERLIKPTNIKKAKSLGYLAIQGVVVIRGKIRKGSFRKPSLKATGRKPSKRGIKKITLSLRSREIIERRISKKYPNLVILGSYWMEESGQHKWYEIIFVDPQHPSIRNRQKYKSLIESPGVMSRQFRGATSAGKKSKSSK